MARAPRWSPIADICMCAGMLTGLVAGLLASWSLVAVLPSWALVAVLGAAILVGMLGGGSVGDRIEFGDWRLGLRPVKRGHPKGRLRRSARNTLP